MARKKGVEEDDIFRRVAESEGVLHEGTQADYVRFFDDKSTYTGTHLYGGEYMIDMYIYVYDAYIYMVPSSGRLPPPLYVVLGIPCTLKHTCH